MKILLSLVLLLSMNIFAAEKTSVKTSEIKAEAGNQIKGDIDAEIEDSKLRAESGSKSRYSGSVSLNYIGGSMKKPFSNSRPVVGNPIAGEREADASINGKLAIRYRINKNESLSLSTGVSKVRPFDNDQDNDWEAKNISLVYGNWFRYKKNQMFTNVMAYGYTEDQYQEANYVGTLATALGGVRKLGTSRFELGLTGYLSYTFFDGEQGFNYKTPFLGKKGDIREYQIDSIVSLNPRLQYRFSDRFNLYTDIEALSYVHSRDQEDMKFTKSDITQTVGAGIAVYRDFYVAPNIGFFTEDIRADTSTFNVSVIANIL